MTMRSLLFGLLMVLSSCTHSVTRREAVETAWRYSALEWMPEARHAHHGPDSKGILVHTPDRDLAAHGMKNGWWVPGQPAKGMPYQWGGFDTPESFLRSVAKGEYAGDVSTQDKRAKGDDAVSEQAAGIDCSGLVSRCWGLKRPYSTKQLPEICDRLSSWDELKAGDILLNDRHVLLFKGWQNTGETILAYEAGPFPVWRVNSAAIGKAKLLKEGYAPWRYRGIVD